MLSSNKFQAFCVFLSPSIRFIISTTTQNVCTSISRRKEAKLDIRSSNKSLTKLYYNLPYWLKTKTKTKQTGKNNNNKKKPDLSLKRLANLWSQNSRGTPTQTKPSQLRNLLGSSYSKL